MEAELYIDASVSIKRRNGKCAAVVLVGDEQEYVWTKSLTWDNLISLFNVENTGKDVGSTAYEAFSLFGFTQSLIDNDVYFVLINVL